jgi:hypothetical protein
MGGAEIRALRRLKREQAESRHVFLTERVAPMAESLSRPPTYQDGTNFVSASFATHSQTSPAFAGTFFAVGTFFCLL